MVRHRDVVGRIPAFPPGSPVPIAGGVSNYNFCPGTVCVFFVCVLASVVFGGGPDILLIPRKPIQIPFRPPRNLHGITETRTRDHSGVMRVSNRLRHEAAL